MARKDDILKSFLEHDILISKYEIKKNELPETVREALKSDVPIIRAIATIVENLESPQGITDKALRDLILQLINQTAI